MVVRRFSIAEVVPVYVCLSPSCFWTCPTSAPTLQSALSRYSAISTLSEIRDSGLQIRMDERPTQDAETREREAKFFFLGDERMTVRSRPWSFVPRGRARRVLWSNDAVHKIRRAREVWLANGWDKCTTMD